MFFYLSAYSSHFGSLSVFAWLNLISVDLYVKIKSFPSQGINIKDVRRFFIYTAFPFTYPAILTSILMLLSMKYKLIRIGETRCYLDDFHTWGHFVFFIIPGAIQIIFNIIIFVATMVHYKRIKRSLLKFREVEISTNEALKRNSEAFQLMLKILIVMGLPWILEIFMHFFLTVISLQIIGDSINTLQGVFIFGIFVCKKTIWNKLMVRFGAKSSSSRSTNFTSGSKIVQTSIELDHKRNQISEDLSSSKKNSTEK